jgi:hypothetical protein
MAMLMCGEIHIMALNVRRDVLVYVGMDPFRLGLPITTVSLFF